MISDRRHGSWLTIAAAVVFFSFVASCGGSAGPVPLVWLGHGGHDVPAMTAANVFWVDVGVDGKATAQVIVDTGSPIAFLHTDAFQGAVPNGSGRVAAMMLGGTILWKVPTVGIKGDGSLAPNGEPFGGLIGHTVFGQFETSFNYRDRQVVFGSGPLPDGVEAPLSLPFSAEGGGVGLLADTNEVIDFPASRVIVGATVEGRPLTFLLDTGASWVALRTPLFEEITSDGRGTLIDDASLASGDTTTRVTRLRSVELQGATVTTAVAAAGAGVDALVNAVSNEVGHSVDGLLGAPFLQEFFVRVGYPSGRLDLYRYIDESHVVDEYRRVGITIRGVIDPLGTAYVVQRVFDGSDAARQQILVDDNLLAIDGTTLAPLDIVTVDRMLLGPVGSMHRIGFATRVVDVLVDELLPLP